MNLVMPRSQWWKRAACRGIDPETFFPKKPRDSWPALRVCAGCPVREACLEWALETRQDYGVWGGVPEDERRAMHGRWERRPARAGPRVEEFTANPGRLLELLEGGATPHEAARVLGTNVATINRAPVAVAGRGEDAAAGSAA